MGEPRLNRIGLAVTVSLVLGVPTADWPGPAIAQPARSSSQKLVPAQFNRNIPDSMGFVWDINEQGAVKYGTNRGFSSAGVLTVNGSTVSPTHRRMTSDGMEYVLTYTRPEVQVTRRVRVDVKTGTLRYVDSFHNPKTVPVTLDVKVMTSLRTSVSTVVTDMGRPVLGSSSSPRLIPVRPGSSSRLGAGTPLLTDKECGLLITRSSTSYPAVLVYLGGARSKLKPSMQKQSSYRFLFSYPVTVPPKKTVSIVHGLAQRNIRGVPDPKTLASHFKPFQSREWTRDLPLAVRRTILNGGRPYYAEETPRSPLLQPVTDLTDHWDVERGKADVLVQDEQTRMPGAIMGGKLTVQTMFGKTTVPLADVAVLSGGGGLGRTMRTHLRNGEILVGSVEAGELTLESESGLELELTPKQINLLFMHADPADGKPPAKAVALVKTHRGDQLALAAGSASKVRAATAWGPLDVPLGEVDYLYPVRDPQPIHRLILNNKSRLSVILGGSELELSTLRFGSVKLAPGAIARLASVKAAEEAEKESPKEGEEEQLKVPHCRLLGDNVLVGSIDAARLELLTAGGVTPVDARLLRLIQRQDEDEEVANPAFTFELANGTELVGRLREGVFPFRALGKSWKVPAYHVLSFHQPEQTAAASAGEAEPPGKEEPDREEPVKEKAVPGGRTGGEPTLPTPSVRLDPIPEPVPRPPSDDPFGR